MRIAVTGGAGFIGSHITDSLIAEGHEVLIIDNLSSDKAGAANPDAELLRKDIRDISRADLEQIAAVFHLAAEPDVRSSAEDPLKFFEVNVKGTLTLLEACRKADVKRFIFSSTSTVYGETSAIPTPEDHPCRPISNYGASKLCCEAFLSSFSASYGIKGTSLRLANIYGERSRRGVMYDLFQKLSKDQENLEILGDGDQDKSYLYVSDCVSAFLTAWKQQKNGYEVFNVGSREKHTVTEIAKMEADLLGLNPRFTYTGGGGGWKGDVKVMLLDSSKLEALGWRAMINLDEGLKRYLVHLKPNH